MNKAFMRIEEAPAGAAGGSRLRHRTGRHRDRGRRREEVEVARAIARDKAGRTGQPFAAEEEIYSLTVTVTRP